MQHSSDFISILSPAETLEKVKNGAFVLDVRTPEEFAHGHLNNARNIPHDELLARIDELQAHKDSEIIAYCKSGGRSEYARELLSSLGFRRVYNSGAFTELHAVFSPAGLGNVQGLK